MDSFGGVDYFRSTLAGGYLPNARVMLANGDIVKSTVDGNTNDPNVNMTGWEKPTISDELVIVKHNAAGTVARTQGDKNSERVSVKDFGAKGDGVTDDSAAITNGINYAQANNIELYFPSGVYAIKSWSSITLSGNLEISGDGFNNSIIRGLNSDSFTLFRKIKSLVIQGMCFESLTTVFDYNAETFETWVIDNLVITDCLFKGLGYCGKLSTYRGSANLYTAKNLKVANNRVEDCGGGFYLNINSFEAAINDNVFLRIGAQNRKLITVAGISAGADNLLDEDNTRLQGRTIISGNIFKDFLNTEPAGEKGACNFIQMFSNEAIISNNIGVNLKNANPLLSDQEAMYWKGKKVQVLNNTFIDAGGYEAVIRCKGIAALIPDIVVIKNNLIIFNETSLNQRIGINVTEGDCFIANNVLIGCGTQGIVVGSEYPSANSADIINNQILGLNTSSNYCRGISLLNNGDIRVKNNVIKYAQITNTAAYAINIEVLLDPLNGINIEIEDNSISYLNGVSGASGSCRAIFINYDSATVINSLSIIGNKTYVPTSEREVYGYRGTGTIKSMYFMDNILNVGDVGPVYGYVHTGVVTNRFASGNIGYPTLEPIQKGVTANRPVSPSLGDRYYDTTLLASGKPITWNGTTWVDAAGTPV